MIDAQKQAALPEQPDYDDYPPFYEAICEALKPDPEHGLKWRCEARLEQCDARLKRADGLQLYLYHNFSSQRLEVQGLFYGALPGQEPKSFDDNPREFYLTCKADKSPEQIAKEIDSRLIPRYKTSYQERLPAFLAKEERHQQRMDKLIALAAIAGTQIEKCRFYTNFDGVQIAGGIGSNIQVYTCDQEKACSLCFGDLPFDLAQDVLKYTIARIQEASNDSSN